MKKTIAAFLSALALSFLAACGGGAANAAGTYTIDKAQLKQAMMGMLGERAQADPEAAAKGMDEVVNGMDFTIELKADGTAHFQMKASLMGQQMEESQKGTWKLAGGKLTTTMKSEKTGKEETNTYDYANGSFTFEGDLLGKKMKMTFKKK